MIVTCTAHVSDACWATADTNLALAQQMLDATISYTPLDPTGNISLSKHREQLHKGLLIIWPQNTPPTLHDQTLQSILLGTLNTTKDLVTTSYWRKRTARRNIENLFALARLEVHEALAINEYEEQRTNTLLFLKALEGQVIHRIMGTTTKRQTIAAWCLFGGITFLITSGIALHWWLQERGDRPSDARVHPAPSAAPAPDHAPAPPHPPQHPAVQDAPPPPGEKNPLIRLQQQAQNALIQQAKNGAIQAVDTPQGWTVGSAAAAAVAYAAYTNPAAATFVASTALLGWIGKSILDQCRRGRLP